MNVNYINPFVEASVNVLKSFCNMEAKLGRLSVKPIQFDEGSKVILIGITGQVKGQVFIGFNNKLACEIVSSMMGMAVDNIDALGESALAEIGNMIMGNTATIFSTRNIKIDITPPTFAVGNMNFEMKGMEHIFIPLIVGDKEIEMHVALK